MICYFLFGPSESLDKQQLTKNVAILMQNQNLQESFIGSSVQANNITHIHLAKNRHIISRLVDTLKSMNYTMYNNN